MRLILDRLREPSTMAGLSMLAALFGAPPDAINSGAQIVAALAGIAAVLIPEGRAAP